MTNSQIKPDPAAVFAAAFSLWEACDRRAKHEPSLNLSDAYSGYDQLMREVMRIGELFETWACEHIDFDANEEVWPYMLGDRFGENCLTFFRATELASFRENDCLRIAIKLSLPIKSNGTLPLPIDITVGNPNPTSDFISFRIQTVRESAAGDGICPFTRDDDPFDPRRPFFGLYGIGDDDLLEHIADRQTFAEAATLLENLVPGINLADVQQKMKPQYQSNRARRK